MFKILAGLGLLAVSGTAVVMLALLSPSGPSEPQFGADPIEAKLAQAPAYTEQYDYQSVWALFEETCRSDGFTDDECACLMQNVSAEHGVDATAWLALMGWDRFAEADVIKARRGDEQIKNVMDLYHAKANGACTHNDRRRDQTDSVPDGAAMPDDAVTIPTGAAADTDNEVIIADSEKADRSTGTDRAEDDSSTDTVACSVENATTLPKNLGTPILRLRNGNIEPLQVLSAGMRQRTGLARDVMASADILLLDEPASELDPVSRSELEACFIYYGTPTRLGSGPARGFVGELSLDGSDIPITSGAEYVVWDETIGSTSRHTLDERVDLDSRDGTQIVFLNVNDAAAGPVLDAEVDIEISSSGPTVKVGLMGSHLAMLMLIGASLDYQYLNLSIGGWWLSGPLPTQQVILVPEGQLDLTWEEGKRDGTVPKLCFATQLALTLVLSERGYSAYEIAQLMAELTEGANDANPALCLLFQARAILGVSNGSNAWQANISIDDGPGLHIIQLEH